MKKELGKISSDVHNLWWEILGCDKFLAEIRSSLKYHEKIANDLVNRSDMILEGFKHRKTGLKHHLSKAITRKSHHKKSPEERLAIIESKVNHSRGYESVIEIYLRVS